MILLLYGMSKEVCIVVWIKSITIISWGILYIILVAFQGDAKASKTRSAMKWWSKCISMAIAKTASRNVAFKVAKIREAIMEDQDEFLMRNSGQTEVG